MFTFLIRWLWWEECKINYCEYESLYVIVVGCAPAWGRLFAGFCWPMLAVGTEIVNFWLVRLKAYQDLLSALAWFSDNFKKKKNFYQTHFQTHTWVVFRYFFLLVVFRFWEDKTGASTPKSSTLFGSCFRVCLCADRWCECNSICMWDKFTGIYLRGQEFSV